MRIALLCLLFAATAAHAAEPTPAQLKSATELVKLIDIEKTMGVGAESMANAMIGQNSQLAPYRDVLLKWSASVMTIDNIGPQLARVYSETYSESELRDLIAFYKTPLGKKTLSTMPDIARKSSDMASTLARQHLPELEKLMNERSEQLKNSKPTESLQIDPPKP